MSLKRTISFEFLAAYFVNGIVFFLITTILPTCWRGESIAVNQFMTDNTMVVVLSSTPSMVSQFPYFSLVKTALRGNSLSTVFVFLSIIAGAIDILHYVVKFTPLQKRLKITFFNYIVKNEVSMKIGTTVL